MPAVLRPVREVILGALGRTQPVQQRDHWADGGRSLRQWATLTWAKANLLMASSFGERADCFLCLFVLNRSLPPTHTQPAGERHRRPDRDELPAAR
jgi:hypothetical protein